MSLASFPALARTAVVLSLLSAPLTAATVLIDFGLPNTTGNWNGVSDSIAGTVANAIDSTGANTGVTVAVTSRFNAVNTNGTTDPTAPYPSFATSDSFYGNALASFNGFGPVTSSAVTFSGLNPALTYNFTFFASRTGVADNRDTRYTLTGTGSPQFAELNAANNVTNTVAVNNIHPTAGGVISLNVGMGAANNNPTGFYYLGTVQIDYAPEPASSMLVAAGAGLVALRRRRH